MTSQLPYYDQHLNQSERRDLTFVQPEEYCRLLLSWRKMTRVDEANSDFCGLLDLQSGKRYLIERQRLLKD